MLAELLGTPVTGGRDLRGVLGEFQRQRKPHADAIADMAVENFVEMRDKTARPEFRYKKQVEQAVHEMFPERVTPQYNLVSFSTVAYAEAKRRGAELDALVDRLLAHHPHSCERGAFGPEVRETAAKLLGAGS